MTLLDQLMETTFKLGKERDRLREQLFEAREQRDEARQDEAGMRNQWQAREGMLKSVHDELRALREERDEHKCAPAYAPQPPHDHVIMSLAGYNKLVKDRDEALAKYAACVDTVSFINGRWEKTS